MFGIVQFLTVGFAVYVAAYKIDDPVIVLGCGCLAFIALFGNKVQPKTTDYLDKEVK